MTQYVCFVGASTLEGMGDEAGLGWPGRLRDLTAPARPGLVAYNLGVRGQTTAVMAARWRQECVTRLPKTMPGLVVFSFGINDIAQMEDGSIRVPFHDTMAAVRRMVMEARKRWPVLWVGPMPVLESRMPFYFAQIGQNLHYRNAHIALLNQSYRDTAAEQGIPYFDLFTPLNTDDRWAASLAGGDGLHPTGAGYQRVAELMADWPDWQRALK